LACTIIAILNCHSPVILAVFTLISPQKSDQRLFHFVHCMNGEAMLCLSQCYHYPKDNEHQLGTIMEGSYCLHLPCYQHHSSGKLKLPLLFNSPP
jgi:hypothetical protein